MTVHKTRAPLLATTCLTGALLAAAWSGSALAADPTSAASPDASSASVGEVVVTGSLIRRTNVETPSPVTVLTSENLTKAGITDISDAIRSISADNSGTIPNAFSDGFAAGASGVALRGLTVNSTLVLIDGLRAANYPLPDDGVRGFVDLNTIPFSAVQQVEVLKDGASSIYGADAIGGVVNVIMKKTFTGEEGDVQFGGTQHGGGFGQHYTATVGHGDLDTDRYNGYLDVEYQGDDRILNSQRGFPYNTNDLSSIGGNNNIGGQPGNNSGSIFGSVEPGTITGGNVLSGVPLNANEPTQVLRACGAGTKNISGQYCEQNFSNYTDIQPEEYRFAVLGRFTYQLNSTTQAYIMGSYSANDTVTDQPPAQIQASTPINTNTIALPAVLTNGQLNPNNPFAALGQAALINYAFGDIPSYIRLSNHMARVVTGIEGSDFGWDWKGSLDFNHGWLDTTAAGFIYEPQLISDVETGAYNFINPASNSAAVRNALAPTLYKTSTSDLDSLDLSATRKVWDLPGGPLSVGVGGQVRYEAVNNPDINTNNEVAAGDGTVQPAYTFGHRNVEGIFFEVEAPVIKQLVFNVSGRYDHYSDAGGNFSPKFGVKFTPIKQIAFRATYSDGFRAPSFSESGNSGVIGYIPYSTSTSAPAAYNNAHGNDVYTTTVYQLNGSTVGNPNIKPEKSQSFTAGVIVEPFSWFNASVDYYDIRKTNVIGNPNEGAILAAYYNGTPLPAGVTVVPDVADPQFPNALPRPLVIDEPYVNGNTEETSGLDFDARVKLNLPYDVRWTSDLNVTDIISFVYNNGGDVENYVGTQAPYELSSGAGTPKWRANWENSFTYEKLNVTGTLYYVSPISETGTDATFPFINACLYSNNNTGAPFPNDCQVGAYWEFDLTGRYQLTDNLAIYANIYDLFDTKPALDPANYAGGPYGLGSNYNPTYAQEQAIGRAFKIGVHVKY